MPNTTQEAKLQRQLKSAKRSLRRALPHDPSGANHKRAARAKEMIHTYRQLTGAKRKNAVGDLLCDLMHVGDRDRRFRSFGNSLKRAKRCYLEEIAEPFS